MKTPLTVLVLTYNEELNLEHCLKSVASWADQLIVVDSFSTDATKAIAKRYGAEVYEHPFANQAQQFNWALDNVPIRNEWILRLDADEYVMPELACEIQGTLPHVSREVGGFFMKRRVYFMGRWIKHGGYYPTWILRLFRKGDGRSEEREMDEHIVLSRGRAEKLNNDFVDYNRKGLEFWIQKHNNFSSREVREMTKARNMLGVAAKASGSQVERKRWFKGIYSKLPLFWRVRLYFFYRYIARLGFLDGREGRIFHFLQGYWYRYLIDAKLYETLKAKTMREEGVNREDLSR